MFARNAPSPDLHLTFPADPLSVRCALLQVMAGLHPLAAPSDLRSELELVLAEVLNNIVEHAYAGGQDAACPGDGIDMQITFLPDMLLFHISDQGTAMPGGQLPAGKQARLSVPLETLPEGGFGWFLIHALTRDLTYCREGSHNRLRFSLEWSGSGRP